METLFSFRYMRIIVAALGVIILLAVAAYVAQMLNLISYEPDYATINVEGVSEVTAVPDVGTFSFTVKTEAEDVTKAQEMATKKINDIMEYLKNEGGVEEKDIKTTGYNVRPRYEWRKKNCDRSFCDNERVLVGYEVVQNVRVKVRDTKNAGNLIAGVGTRGATNISNLSFEVDDIEALKEQARLQAIADAKQKAERLADELGVRLGKIIDFSDSGSGGVYPMPYMKRGMAELSFAEDDMVKTTAPDIAVGEDTIIARVIITYKIK